MVVRVKYFENDQLVLFTGKETIYSQFYGCNFIIDGITFNCCEQWMMYNKAVLFSDDKIKEKILNSNDPKIIKKLGRKVKDFDYSRWLSVCNDVVYKGNLEKFSQNPELKEKLLNTGDKLIIECSWWDKKWGSGFGIKNTQNRIKKGEEIGENKLGLAIMRVRSNLIN